MAALDLKKERRGVLSHAWSAAGALALTTMLGCGPSAKADAGPPATSPTSSGAASGASSASASSEGDSAAAEPPRRAVSPNVEIVNQCAEGVPVYFGETPNGTTGSFAKLRPGGTSHIARDEHGELVLWIVDDKGFGLAHVRATKRMRRIEIGTSCSTLNAN